MPKVRFDKAQSELLIYCKYNPPFEENKWFCLMVVLPPMKQGDSAGVSKGVDTKDVINVAVFSTDDGCDCIIDVVSSITNNMDVGCKKSDGVAVRLQMFKCS